jgi:hypothetical protein
MPSAKANEIQYRIVGDGKTDYWIGVAKTFIKKKDQYKAGKDWERDRAGLVERLKTELSGQFADANDEQWGEIADSLFKFAIPK